MAFNSLLVERNPMLFCQPKSFKLRAKIWRSLIFLLILIAGGLSEQGSTAVQTFPAVRMRRACVCERGRGGAGRKRGWPECTRTVIEANTD